MSGIPYHSLQAHLLNLMKANYGIVIAEQIEGKTIDNNIVDRKVTRILTPGTIVENDLLKGYSCNYISSIISSNNSWIISNAEITDGQFNSCICINHYQLMEEIYRINPSEILISKKDEKKIIKMLSKYDVNHSIISKILIQDHQLFNPLPIHTSNVDINRFDSKLVVDDDQIIDHSIIQSASALLRYIHSTHPESPPSLSSLSIYQAAQYMQIDNIARRNLELINSISSKNTKSYKGSLYAAINRTETTMGTRLLYKWLSQPLYNQPLINQRLDTVEYLIKHHQIRTQLQSCLQDIKDLDRITSRCLTNKVSPRDLYHLSISLQSLDLIKKILNSSTDKIDVIEQQNLLLNSLKKGYKELVTLGQELEQYISPTSPYINNLNSLRFNLTTTKGSSSCIINKGVDKELDQLRDISSNQQVWIDQYTQQQRLITKSYHV